ncbi:MAG: hypothetical protein ACI8QZ_003818 [Chlamydiales bacterium]|jgi:hypothetical protein
MGPMLVHLAALPVVLALAVPLLLRTRWRNSIRRSRRIPLRCRMDGTTRALQRSSGAWSCGPRSCSAHTTWRVRTRLQDARTTRSRKCSSGTWGWRIQDRCSRGPRAPRSTILDCCRSDSPHRNLYRAPGAASFRTIPGQSVRATRKPIRLLRVSGPPASRTAERQRRALSYQDPPRRV